MEQQDIRAYNGQQYSVEEGAALIEQLDARTKHDVHGYNSIEELGIKLKGLLEAEGFNTLAGLLDTNLEALVDGGILRYDAGSSKWIVSSYVPPPTLVKETANTGAIIDLGYVGGNTCNMASANASSSYTLVNSVINGNAEVLINRSTEPTITGATAFTDSGFVADTNQIMCVKNYGGSIGVKFYFLTV